MTDKIDDEGSVIGDGVITIPVEEGEENVPEPIDLSPNVANVTLTESSTNMQASNRNSRGVFDAVMGAIAGTVQTNFAEVGVLEGRAVSGVNATDLGGPTNAGRPAGA